MNESWFDLFFQSVFDPEKDWNDLLGSSSSGEDDDEEDEEIEVGGELTEDAGEREEKRPEAVLRLASLRDLSWSSEEEEDEDESEDENEDGEEVEDLFYEQLAEDDD